ncbi:MAG: hypothetical protein PUP92_38170 [Rhizonema sp. PD38]|nr:hypothetical protein [Rhizonema sp. PD38]
MRKSKMAIALVNLRSSTYQYSDFLQEFTTYFDTIRDSVPNVPFSGPTTANGTDTWVVPFAKDAASRIILLTQHYYRMGRFAQSSHQAYRRSLPYFET